MLKIWLAAFSVWLGCSVTAMAQEAPPPDRIALGREVVTLAGGEEMFTSMFEQMRPLMIEDFRSRGISQELAERFADRFSAEFAREAPRFAELSAIAYANAFNDQELRDMAAFFRTPSGRAMVERQPQITAAMMRAGQIVGAEVAQRVVAEMNERPPAHNP